jgi:hypothetical protein
MKTDHNLAPQLCLRSGLTAGESVQACLNNLATWTKQLQTKCSGASAPYAPGYAPWLETEMQPWQAGDV